jgi:hypothetical protein
MNIRAKIFGGIAEEPLVRAKQPKGAQPDMLHSVTVSRAESRRGNQRGGDRHRLAAEQSVLRHNGDDHAVELINLSAGGAMVRGQLELMLWDKVGLVLGEEGELSCAVRWIKGDRLGLEFAHETRIDCEREARDELLRAVIRKSFPEVAFDPLAEPEVDEEPESEEAVESRCAPRHPLIWSGIVYHNYDAEPVRLRNISATGALVQSGSEWPEGATVYLDLGAAGKLEAVVRWVRGDQAGLAFTEPFDVRDLSQLRPDVAERGPSSTFGNESSEAWAPGWKRSTIDEMARSLGG